MVNPDHELGWISNQLSRKNSRSHMFLGQKMRKMVKFSSCWMPNRLVVINCWQGQSTIQPKQGIKCLSKRKTERHTEQMMVNTYEKCNSMLTVVTLWRCILCGCCPVWAIWLVAYPQFSPCSGPVNTKAVNSVPVLVNWPSVVCGP